MCPFSTASFDFPANYVVLNFDGLPSIEESAALFETVGEIDPEIFETDTSGYTQYGFAYLSLQSFVPDEQFIAGYVQAADEFGVECANGPRVGARGEHRQGIVGKLLAKFPGLGRGGHPSQVGDGIEAAAAVRPPDGEPFIAFEIEVFGPVLHHGILSAGHVQYRRRPRTVHP